MANLEPCEAEDCEMSARWPDGLCDRHHIQNLGQELEAERYHHAETRRALDSAYAQIGKLERERAEDQRVATEVAASFKSERDAALAREREQKERAERMEAALPAPEGPRGEEG